MPARDRYGLPLSTSSDTAAAAYRDGVDCSLAAWPGAAQAMDAAIAADPEFALPYIARARIHATFMQAPAALAMASEARRRVAVNGTPREKSHVEALALGVEGQSAKSLALALAHIEQWPRDALVMSAPLGAFGLYAFSGMADHDQARVDLCEMYAHHYGEDWWFLAYLGWSHTENGNVAHGRRLSEQAFALRRENANALHAVSHAMFEDGSVEAAETLIDAWLPGYDRSGLLHGHISWHQTLLALERGDAARAMSIYEARIAPDVTHAFPLNLMTDAASLLWRLKLYGHEVPARLWTDAATYGARTYPKSGNPFADVHLCFLAAATGDHGGLDRRIAEIDSRLADGKIPAGPVVSAMCRAVSAYASEDYRACCRLLQPVANDVVRIGGSHAQREIIEDMLLVALMKSGEAGPARTLLDERLHRRPSPRDAGWRASLSA